MATTDLKLDNPGTLPKPGPIGRIVRFGFGVICLQYVYSLWHARDALILTDGSIRQLLWTGLFFGLILINYVINIGYSRSWRKWPIIASVFLILAAAETNYLIYNNFLGQFMAEVLCIWLLYTFSHLGLAFILSGIISTPGCEMRAFHHLYTKITGNLTKEHHCPIGPLHAIDKWESNKGIKYFESKR